MKRKEGFTLIELLAVIVILAVIALIATPIIMGVINDAKKGAFKDTAYGIIKAGDLYFAEQLQNELFPGKSFSFWEDQTELQLTGEKITKGLLSINSKGEQSLLIADKNNAWCAQKGYSEEKISVTDYKKSHCYSFDVIPTLTFNDMVKDFSKNHQDGIVHNVAVQNGEAIFDGTNYISAGYTNYEFKEGITFVGRFFYGNDITGQVWNDIVGNWEVGGGGIAVNNQYVNGELWVNGSYHQFLVADIAKEKYHTVVVTYDGAHYRMYIDGLLRGREEIIGKMKITPVPIMVGANPNLSDISSLAKTKMTDVLVMDRGVSESEVSQYFKDTIPILQDDAVLFQYKFGK